MLGSGIFWHAAFSLHHQRTQPMLTSAPTQIPSPVSSRGS